MLDFIASFFLLGLTFGAGPCLASCGPVLICYVAGSGRGMAKGFKAYLLFSSVRIFVYLAMVTVVFFLGKALNAIQGFSKFISVGGGIFIILVGMFMAMGRKMEFGFFKTVKEHFLDRENRSIIVLALITGLLPCAPLIAVLYFIGASSRSLFSSLLNSFSFGLGTFLSPLIFLVILGAWIPRFFSLRNNLYGRIFNLVCGLITIFLGARMAWRFF